VITFLTNCDRDNKEGFGNRVPCLLLQCHRISQLITAMNFISKLKIWIRMSGYCNCHCELNCQANL